MRAALSLAALVLAVVLAGGVAGGEPPETGSPQVEDGRPGLPGPGHYEDKDVHELVQTVMMVRLSRVLELDEEETVVMVRRFEKLRSRMSELYEERQTVYRELRDAMETENADAEIEAKLSRLLQIDRDLHEARLAAYEESATDLTPQKRAKLYVFLQEFQGQMRRLIERARRGGTWNRDSERPGSRPGEGDRPDMNRSRDDRNVDEDRPRTWDREDIPPEVLERMRQRIERERANQATESAAPSSKSPASAE